MPRPPGPPWRRTGSSSLRRPGRADAGGAVASRILPRRAAGTPAPVPGRNPRHRGGVSSRVGPRPRGRFRAAALPGARPEERP